MERLSPLQQIQVKIITQNSNTTHLSEHEANGVPRDTSLRIEIVEMVHDELSRRREVGLIELVGNVPPEGTELATFLQI